MPWSHILNFLLQVCATLYQCFITKKYSLPMFYYQEILISKYDCQVFKFTLGLFLFYIFHFELCADIMSIIEEHKIPYHTNMCFNIIIILQPPSRSVRNLHVQILKGGMVLKLHLKCLWTDKDIGIIVHRAWTKQPSCSGKISYDAYTIHIEQMVY